MTKQPEHKRMTDDELEKEMKAAISDKSGFYMASELKKVISVAKKYRGEL